MATCSYMTSSKASSQCSSSSTVAKLAIVCDRLKRRCLSSSLETSPGKYGKALSTVIPPRGPTSTALTPQHPEEGSTPSTRMSLRRSLPPIRQDHPRRVRRRRRSIGVAVGRVADATEPRSTRRTAVGAASGIVGTVVRPHLHVASLPCPDVVLVRVVRLYAVDLP